MTREPVSFANPPSHCSLCEEAIDLMFFDAKTRMGSWAYMCPECFDLFGAVTLDELGTGKGQMWSKTDGKYYKEVFKKK